MNFFFQIITAICILVCINQNVSAQSWDVQNSGTNITTFNDVFFVSETTGWAVGTSGQILHTTDGGTTWANQFANVIVASALNGVCFTSATDGWIVGNNGVLLHTTNAGSNWTLIDASFGSLNLNGIDFIDGMTGMIVGESSHIRLTTDGGATWTYSSHWNPNMNLTKADMANATQITCLYSSSPYWANVGNSWNSVVVSNLGYTQPYNDLWFNNGVGYVVGLNGIAKTTNFSTYSNQLSQTNIGLNGVHFTSNDVGWAVGDQGKNYYTTDGGANWYNLAAATTSSLKAVHFVNPTHGWAVGENGTILKFNTCQNTSSTLTVTACGSYTLNGQTYTSSNFYNQTVPNANGCDSLITLDLTITSPINNDVFLTGTTISATESGLNYQWINCANNAPIAGANTQTFTPTASGSYAVIVSNSNCSDTSTCQVVTTSTSGIEEQTASNFTLFPNPASDLLTLNNLKIGTTILVKDMTGKTVFEKVVNSTEMTFDTQTLNSGIYFVQVTTNSSIISSKKLAISK